MKTERSKTHVARGLSLLLAMLAPFLSVVAHISYASASERGHSYNPTSGTADGRTELLGFTLSPVVVAESTDWDGLPAQGDTESPDPPPLQKMVFYVASPAVPGFRITGHSFVQLRPNAGPQAGNPNLVYGLYPFGPNIFNDGGVIRNDSLHAWDWRIACPVTAAEYNAVAAFIRAQIALPAGYNIFNLAPRLNCTGWSEVVALTIPIALPPPLRTLRVPDPAAQERSLARLGVRRVLVRGIVPRVCSVLNNPLGVLPNAAPDPTSAGLPDQGSVTALQQFLLDDPQAAAAASDLEFDQEAMASQTIPIGGVCNVSLENVAADMSLILVDFDDNSVAQQATHAMHGYQSPGLHILRVIVMNSGAVDEFDVPVNVGAAGTCSVSISVPDPPPEGAPFPAGPPPIAPLDIP